MADDVINDRFETVAVTWSQPEAAVMLSMFEFYGIPAYAIGQLHASAMPSLITVLQGIQVRVAVGALDDALELLAEVATRPAAVRPYPFGSATFYRAFVVTSAFGGVIGIIRLGDADPLGVLLSIPLMALMSAAPPTRTASTFMLGKRGGAAPA